MLIFVVPFVWMAGALSVIANVCFGVGIVSFNAFLPLLVRNIEHIRTSREQLEQLEREFEDPIVSHDQTELETVDNAIVDDSLDNGLHTGQRRGDEQARTLAERKKKVAEHAEQLDEEKNQLMSYISARGFAAGYLGGILLLVLCLYISYRDKSSMQSLKVGIFLSGLWWFLFAALAGFWLKPRPGSDLILDDDNQRHGPIRKVAMYIAYSWSRVGRTIAHARQLPSAFAFLMAWFFLSDGYTSIANVAILFAKTSLGLSQTKLILLSLVVPICALIGTLMFPRIQQLMGYDQKQMVLLLLTMLVMVPVYGTLGLIFSFWPHLSSEGELFAVAIYFGFLIGAIQSYCRSMFASLVPRGRESEFFGLYAITDKGSSWLGPLAIALITDATHEIRHAFIFLLILLSIPIPIIYFGVDVTQGRIDAELAAQEQAAVRSLEQGAVDAENERLLSAL
ncbi:Autophagy protein 22 [Podila epigama]|nr:Autophagy protein 22 [Podila epigama]